MAALPPPVAALRVAVRQALSGVRTGSSVLVACSGGADSLALAATVAFVAPRLDLRPGLVTVDHQLQPGSADRAAKLVAWAAERGFVPAEVAVVDVRGRPGGPEAAARDARYEALSAAAERHGAAAVLLGNTRDDQAETVLLALARGAGPRGLSGMPVRRGVFVRPLLDVDRATTRAACRELGLEAWEDPHNADPAYARARVRSTALPALVDALGPGVVANLARTAALIAEDTALLDELAAASETLNTSELAALHPAIRRRVLRHWASRHSTALTHVHLDALDALVIDWHGQGAVHLPGGATVTRRDGFIVLDL